MAPLPEVGVADDVGQARKVNHGTRMPETDTSRGKYIAALQDGRGVAAVVVVLFHAYGFVDLVFGPRPGGKLFQAGHSGVEFFFVLSGFIILTVHRDDLGRPDKLKSFIMKRVARIYPMLWLVVIPLGLWLMLKPSSTANLHPIDLIRDVLLIPRDGSLTLDPAWSLQHEMVFYLLFGLMILSRRLGLWCLITWQASCLVTLVLWPGPQDHMSAVSKFLGYYNFGFVFGMLAAIFYRSAWFSLHKASVRAAGLIAIALLIGMFLGEWHSGVTWLGGGAVTTTIYFTLYTAIMLASLTVRRRLPLGNLGLGALGDASYTIYLTHLPIAGVAIKVLAFLGLSSMMNPTALYLAIVAICILAGLLLHRVVEVPLNAYIKGKLGTRQDQASSRKSAVAPVSATG